MDNNTHSIQLAVVTGGHPFDVRNFRHLFDSLPGITAYVQHMDDFASSSDAERDAYDAVLLYTWLLPTPVDEGLPRYAGRPRSALERLTTTGKGIFVLHHSLLAFRDWPFWPQLVGIQDRRFQYWPEQTITVQVADRSHPISSELTDWTMTDETYTTNEPENSTVLLRVDHPHSMRALAWTRQVDAARVFCLQSGHDNSSWAHPGFRHTLERGIAWCAGRI